jgi:predicted ester cyclase
LSDPPAARSAKIGWEAPVPIEEHAMTSRQDALSAAQTSWNAGDLDGYLSLYDDRIRVHGYSPEPMGKDDARGFYQGFFSAFDTPKLEFHEVLWDGAGCAIRFTMTGRHVGDFMGVAATGAEIALPGITILRFEGSRVIERFSQADMLGLLVQLGALPAPA